MKLEDFTADLVRAHVGTNFHVTLDDGQVVELLLEEVKVVEEKHVKPRQNRDSFILYFVGPDNLYMSQATYNVAHDELGAVRTRLPFLDRDRVRGLRPRR